MADLASLLSSILGWYASLVYANVFIYFKVGVYFIIEGIALLELILQEDNDVP